MPDILKAILPGIIKGVTEFLPVLSTGHLILVNQWISFSEEFTVIFDIFIQLGATIIGALILGTSRKLAAEFSFDLAIPTILAASVNSLLKGGLHFSNNDIIFENLTIDYK
jgi:undecaprenyl pyrophosphate phosphatase UppP